MFKGGRFRGQLHPPFFEDLASKNAPKMTVVYFNQHLGAAHSKRWSK